MGALHSREMHSKVVSDEVKLVGNVLQFILTKLKNNFSQKTLRVADKHGIFCTKDQSFNQWLRYRCFQPFVRRANSPNPTDYLLNNRIKV